jgi:hypothetical protein
VGSDAAATAPISLRPSGSDANIESAGQIFVVPNTNSNLSLLALGTGDVILTSENWSVDADGNITGSSFTTPDVDLSNVTAMFDNSADVVAPSAGAVNFYARTDGELYKRDAGDVTAGKRLLTEDDITGLALNVRGTVSLGGTLITSGTCATEVQSVATGLLSSDTVQFTPASDITGQTGWAPVTTGAVSIYPWPEAGIINWKVCNPTASDITPAAVTFNWAAVR